MAQSVIPNTQPRAGMSDAPADASTTNAKPSDEKAQLLQDAVRLERQRQGLEVLRRRSEEANALERAQDKARQKD